MEYKPLIDYAKPAPRRATLKGLIQQAMPFLIWLVFTGGLFAAAYLKARERMGG